MAKKKDTTRAHARLGPSGFKSREICPSYLPTQGESAASKMGTKLHDLLERFGINVLEEPEFRFLDTGSQMDALQMIKEYVTPFEKTAVKIHREVQFNLESYRIPDCEFGTGDLVLEQADCVADCVFDLMDYKFGYLEVDDPETNIQIWLYVLGLFHNFPKAKCVRAHILQPARDEIGTATFTRDRIPEMLLRAQAIATRVKSQAGKAFNPVLSNCLWCANKGACVALHQMAMKTAVAARLEYPEALSTLVPDDLNDNETIIEYGSSIYDLAKLLEGWADQMKRRLTQLSIEGHELRGKTLRQVSGKANIVDPFGVLDMMLQDRCGKTLAELVKNPDALEAINTLLAAVAAVSITKAENFVASTAERGHKDEAKKELRKRFASEGFLFIGSPSAYLVDSKETKTTTK